MDNNNFSLHVKVIIYLVVGLIGYHNYKINMYNNNINGENKKK